MFRRSSPLAVEVETVEGLVLRVEAARAVTVEQLVGEVAGGMGVTATW